MTVVRRFLVAPSLARLLRKERGSLRITEGYFTPKGARQSCVHMDALQCFLVLFTTENGSLRENRAPISTAHAESLLDNCMSHLVYDRIHVDVDLAKEFFIDHYTVPGIVDIVNVAFDSPEESNRFQAPSWFDKEVTADVAYTRSSLALQGFPPQQDITIRNAALDELLELVEPKFASSVVEPSAPIEGPISTHHMEADMHPAQSKTFSARVQSAQHATAASPHNESAPQPDPRLSVPKKAQIDDVIESLSQALGASTKAPAILSKDTKPKPTPANQWSVRPRYSPRQH